MNLAAAIAFLLDNGWGVDRILTSVSTALLVALLGLNWWLRDSVRDLIKDIHDRNGLRQRTDDHEERLKKLEYRVIGEEAITQHEKEMMQESGLHAKRLRDKLHPDLGNV